MKYIKSVDQKPTPNLNVIVVTESGAKGIAKYWDVTGHWLSADKNLKPHDEVKKWKYSDAIPLKQFSVIAGKHDGQELNCKYSEDFDTLDQAIEAYDTVSGYPWAYIEYKGRIIDVWKEGNNPLEVE